MKTIYFQMIADNRFHENIAGEIDLLHKAVTLILEENGVKVRTDGIAQFIDFKDGTKQYRIDYAIPKTKAHTYNQIYKLINSVQAVPYTVK